MTVHLGIMKLLGKEGRWNNYLYRYISNTLSEEAMTLCEEVKTLCKEVKTCEKAKKSQDIM